MEYINFNHKIIPKSQSVFGEDNRAFRYGDALFETIRMKDGKLCFLEDHFLRLSQGMELFLFQYEGFWNIHFMESQIRHLVRDQGDFRIRFTVYRKGGGTYLPPSGEWGFLVSASPLSEFSFSIDQQGVVLGDWNATGYIAPQVGSVKTANALPYIRARLEASRQGWDDCLLWDDGVLVEATSSNVFVWKKNELITPKLSSGCKGGVVRKNLLKVGQIPEVDIEIREATITRDWVDNNKIDGIILTNAIQGLKRVKEYNGIALESPFFLPSNDVTGNK